MALRLIKTTYDFNRHIATTKDPIVEKGRIIKIGRKIDRWYHFIGIEVIDGHIKNNPADRIERGKVYYFDPIYLEEASKKKGKGDDD